MWRCLLPLSHVYASQSPSPPIIMRSFADRLVVELDDDQINPPAYSTLPPPYSPPVQKQRSRLSSSELRVLVYLYRTVVYGLESRSPPPDLKYKPTKKPLGPRSLPLQFERALAAKLNRPSSRARFAHEGRFRLCANGLAFSRSDIRIGVPGRSKNSRREFTR